MKRTLLRFGRALKTTGNDVDAEAIEIAPTEVRIITRIVPEFRPLITKRWDASAHYRVGVLESALEILKVEGRVELEAKTETSSRTSGSRGTPELAPLVRSR